MTPSITPNIDKAIQELDKANIAVGDGLTKVSFNILIDALEAIKADIEALDKEKQ